jgi:hypothetical protein
MLNVNSGLFLEKVRHGLYSNAGDCQDGHVTSTVIDSESLKSVEKTVGLKLRVHTGFTTNFVREVLYGTTSRAAHRQDAGGACAAARSDGAIRKGGPGNWSKIRMGEALKHEEMPESDCGHSSWVEYPSKG